MPLKTVQTQTQAQRLTLTPYLKQVFYILQLPIMELRQFLEEQLIENPLLEETAAPAEEEGEQELGEDKALDDLLQLNNLDEYLSARDKTISDEEEQRRKFRESLLTKVPTLQSHLLRQLRLLKISLLEDKIGEFLIGNIDHNGYLQIELEEASQKLRVDIGDVKKVLSIIQSFDPPGVGARNLRECLLIQLKQKPNPNPLTAQIIGDYLGELENKRYALIARKLKLSLEEIKVRVEEILKLEPKPGRTFGSEKTNYIIPDLALQRIKNGYKVILNDEDLPQFRISQRYKRLLADKKTPQATKKYLKDKLANALNLIKAVDQRQQTLKQIAETIVKVQGKFLEKGADYFRPLSIRQLARMTKKSESTVSRIIANKYIQSPLGIVELKSFLSPAIKKEKEAISSEKIKAKIKQLVSAEDSFAPLSDIKICQLLKEEGIPISRRAVTKYRKGLKIPSSYQRR